MAEQNGYQIFGRLAQEEYTALEIDIEKRGVQLPIEVDQDGNILDGHHRVEIAEKLGKKYKKIVRRFKTENEKIEHIIKLNLACRRLSPIQWGGAFKQLLKCRGVERKPGRRWDSNSATVAELATELGVSWRTAYRRMGWHDQYEKLPKKFRKQIDNREKTLPQAQLAATPPPRQDKKTKTLVKNTSNERLIHGDYRKIGRKHVTKNSLDLVFTDPPYDRKTIPQYADLGEFAAHGLRDGGSLICYVGHYAVDEIISLIKPHLFFVWMIALYMPRSKQRLPRSPRSGIIVQWRPLLWFSKGNQRFNEKTFINDTVISPEKEKEFHEWQQSIAPALYYIEKLSESDGIICDPYCGSGTTCIAAKQLKRKYIAFDIDDRAIKKTSKRLEDVNS